MSKILMKLHVGVSTVFLLINGVSAAAMDPGTFDELARQINDRPEWNNERLEKEVHRKEALILESDKTPVDVVLRRTAALINDLRTMKSGPELEDEARALNALQEQNRPDLNIEQQKNLFLQIIALRRKIAFQNPLLDFDSIIFIKHNRQRGGDNHMVDQYLGFNQEPRGGVYLLKHPFSDAPEVVSLLKDTPVSNGRLKGRVIEDKGSFISLELDYDAGTILFAFTEAQRDIPDDFNPGSITNPLERLKNGHLIQNIHGHRHYYWTPERVFHIFKMDIDQSCSPGVAVNTVSQLTFGPYNDFDPCVLPGGRIIFISGRIGGNQRCGSRMCSTYTLHTMTAEGRDILPLSFHDTNEWHPSIDNNGMIIYTRWDYVDRDSDIAHHIWHCFPDGRDPRSYHGNWPARRELRPWMELAIRAIPDSHKYVAVAAPHHGQNYGSLVLLDLREKDDRAMSQIKRITPEALLPESERAPGVAHEKGSHNPRGEVYGQPWPLSEDYYLCVYDPRQRNHGLYLVDSFGNKELLYRDPQISCLDPIPFKPRTKPPVIPVKTRQATSERDGGESISDGVVTVMNIYDTEFPFPAGTIIKELRIVNIFPKPNITMNKPNIGRAEQSLCRGVLGTVPVEEDGSVHFKLPAGIPVYFQALDEKGLCVMNMRSETYIHPGEILSCIGCHEPKPATPTMADSNTPLAMMRAPSVITPEATGSYPLSFPRLVQPVLDARCTGCHTTGVEGKKGPSLRGDIGTQHGWSEAFQTLQPLGWSKSGGNGSLMTKNARSYSLPAQDGARVSQLFAMLKKGHHGVKLTPEELRRITLWIDCNCNFYGSYTEPHKQSRGGIVKPLLGLPQHTAFKDLIR